MKFSVSRKAVLSVCAAFFLSGCYYAIPTFVEAVNQNRLQADAEGAILESDTGALKLVIRNNKAADSKLNIYICSYNSIMTGSWSLVPSYKTLTSQTMKARTTGTIAFPVVDGLDKGIALLKKGLAFEEALPELDEAAAAAVAAGETLAAAEKTSLHYFRSQMYKRDNMAGAKKIFPALQKNYEDMIAAMERFGKLLTILQKAETRNRMAAYQTANDTAGYYMEKSLLHSQELIALLNDKSENAPDTANRFAQGDSLLALAEGAVKAQKAVLDRMKPSRDQNTGIDLISRNLTEMAAYYREYKKSRAQLAFNRMMNKYSDAVETYNASISLLPPVKDIPAAGNASQETGKTF